MIDQISLKKRKCFILNDRSWGIPRSVILSFNAELMRLGFILSKNAMNFLEHNGCINEFLKATPNIIDTLKEIKGDDVEYSPMYPNFPQQVMEASDIEHYFNAIMHYYTYGQWKPEYRKELRKFEIEDIKYTEINVGDANILKEIYNQILTSKDSISKEDETFLKFLLTFFDYSVDVQISFSEILGLVVSELLLVDRDITSLVKNSTDILRIATALSDGDMSLSTNTKFKSFPKRIRRKLLAALENVINEEDIHRHKNKWNKLLHGLHIGDFDFPKTKAVAFKIRNNVKIKSFNGIIDELIKKKDLINIIKLLKTRPTEFARRLIHLYDLTNNNFVLDSFLTIVDQVPLKVLTQLIGALQNRATTQESRLVFIKGSTQKTFKINKYQPPIDEDKIIMLFEGISNSMNTRLSKLPKLGKVYIDEALNKCPLPSQMRSSSKGALNLARGTRLPLSNKDTLRFFIYWIGQDIDLSASILDSNFKEIKQISYTNLRTLGGYHSGDITSAINGASEFIDISKSKIKEIGGRYLSMNVYVYRGPNFSQHEVCYAGFMEREKPNSNEIYDPKTVQNKINLTADSRRAIPIIFDLETNEMIWLDIAAKSRYHFWSNNNESNKASTEDIVESVVCLNKFSLGALFMVHALARGEIVKTKEEADIVFSLDGDVTPFDINIINSEYL